MSNILVVGIATLDIINHIDHYPNENEELRANAQTVSSGGNATNTSCVLSQFQHHVELAANLADDNHGAWIKEKLEQQNIATKYCLTINGISPVSCINLNQQNGSRTIVHFRDLPEFQFNDFKKIPLADFDWLHFEGRNIPELHKILKYVKQNHINLPVSIEIEKNRNNIESLIPLANIIIYSSEYVKNSGFNKPEDFLKSIQTQNINAIHVCPQGNQGAWAMDTSCNICHSPAFVPDSVVDTLGAGDTFNAGLIHGIISGQTLEVALTGACQLAGKKVAQSGFNNLLK